MVSHVFLVNFLQIFIHANNVHELITSIAQQLKIYKIKQDIYNKISKNKIKTKS